MKNYSCEALNYVLNQYIFCLFILKFFFNDTMGFEYVDLSIQNATLMVDVECGKGGIPLYW